MSYNDDEKLVPVSNEALLRFLDSNPSVRRSPVLSPSQNSTQNKETPNEAPSPNDLHPPDSSPHCPSPESYITLALGKAESMDAESLLAHAATCNACGDRLAMSLAVLEGDPSPEEAAAISELGASGEWTQAMARRLAATKPSKRISFRQPFVGRRFNSIGGWASAGVAALLVAGVALVVWQRETNTPDHLLAQAYSQARTLELRVPEAGYAALIPGSHTRGSLAGHETAALLEARARLTRSLESSPEDAHLLELQARADLLEERYDSAVEVLDRLIAEGPATAELLIDAASAYYQRGLVSGGEIDRSTALDYLRRADQLAPTDPVILFNEAIVMEDRGQMMNAVEVWNRYVTVERDPNWAAEGKRKLAALEQTLNRLKTHESRIQQMLATPEAMDTLAADASRLASLDEELSSIQLDKLLLKAYPDIERANNEPELNGAGQARGSPCDDACRAARRLLKAIASSLELHHHDFWLSDLLSPDIDTLPAATAANYSQAIRLLAQATREDQTGIPTEGARLAGQARKLFVQLQSSQVPIAVAARSGEDRAAVEYLFALQREADFARCRSFARQLQPLPQAAGGSPRYPWIEIQALTTEKVCDDTPETRKTGRELVTSALHQSEADNYPLLAARIHLMEVADEVNPGDNETAERLTLAVLRDLYTKDSPPIRVANTFSNIPLMEEDSPRAHSAEACFREAVQWLEQVGSRPHAAAMRIDLARAELRIGAAKEAENQLRLAREEGEASGLSKSGGDLYVEAEVLLASAMLERADLAGATHYLDQAAGYIPHYSDTWGLRTYAAVRGQLELDQGRLDQAEGTLVSEIQNSEGKNVRGSDQAAAAEYGQLDHDLYAELAATWLAQGRSPESVLALWERFRMRSRGVPITQCATNSLDCEQERVLNASRSLDGSILTGQIVLLDRVLVYRADRKGVAWSQMPVRRREVLDAAQILEHAVSSPLTAPETVERLGARLSKLLLPQLPPNLSDGALLILEPDPMLQNLPWPVLPASSGSIGLQYPLAESRSILAPYAFGRDRQVGSEIKAGSGHGNGRAYETLVVGASVAADGEPPLPEAIVEANNVNRFLNSPDLLLGERASVSNVAAALSSSSIFHFAGHAVQTPSGTELLLAAATPGEESPWIDGAFLRKHPPRACRLAVLSACATGRREASWNQPLQDMVETLGSLGVPEVVATRWQIDSQASVPFMDAFYRSLAEGNGVAVALTAARRVEFNDSKYNHPYYWGAYYVTGTEKASLRRELHASL